jgi:hypothetical protein
MRQFPASAVVLLALGGFAVADNAAAQAHSAPQPPRVEVWGAVTGVLAGPAGALITSYSPPLLFDGDFTSLGGQALAVDTRFAVGMTGGINVFPSAHVGLQVLLDRASFDVGGTNGAYATALQYVSRQPPNDATQIVNTGGSIAWPDTSGSLTEFAIGLNAVVRMGRPERLSVTVSGGPSYYRISGSVQPLGYTTFHLGGHSVLFEDAYRLAVSLTPAHALGFNTGIEFNEAVGRHAAIVVGYRYFGGPQVDVAVHPTAILNPDEVSFPQSITDVASRLGPTPMRISVSGSRVLVGFKVVR